mmetsp:Transcript_76636/g.228415  ORF Transcript_76636/g.228415 Transcript_76636/m.228415 type:complete len:275 (+) Transcript_76636:648-1472(+)
MAHSSKTSGLLNFTASAFRTSSRVVCSGTLTLTSSPSTACRSVTSTTSPWPLPLKSDPGGKASNRSTSLETMSTPAESRCARMAASICGKPCSSMVKPLSRSCSFHHWPNSFAMACRFLNAPSSLLLSVSKALRKLWCVQTRRRASNKSLASDSERRTKRRGGLATLGARAWGSSAPPLLPGAATAREKAPRLLRCAVCEVPGELSRRPPMGVPEPRLKASMDCGAFRSLKLLKPPTRSAVRLSATGLSARLAAVSGAAVGLLGASRVVRPTVL